MGSVVQVLRAEARRRYASWLALAALVALVGGTVLAGSAAARRTEAAVPDYLSRYGYDSILFSTTPTVIPQVARLAGVDAVVPGPFYANGFVRADGMLVPPGPTFVFGLSAKSEADVAKLTAGRLPRAASEIAIGYAMQQAFHLHLGSTVSVPFYAPRQAQEYFDSNGTPTPHGPRERFRVVGIAASAVDFPTSVQSYTIYVDSAFESTVGSHVVTGVIAYVRLRGGAAAIPRFQAAVNRLHVPSGGFAGIEPADAQISAIESSIHPQAVGWWIFAALAALAGIALIGQALSRQSLVARTIHPALSALGFRPVQLLVLGVARAAAIAVLGCVGALALATALSPLTPVGEARVANLTNGLAVDPTVFVVGGAAIVVVVVVLGALPAWRDAQTARLRRQDEKAIGRTGSRLAAQAARVGAPVPAVVGIRHALERGRGRQSVPVAAALVGTVAAVSALVATSVFGSSLTTLLATPRLYGQDFQLVLGSIPGSLVGPMASAAAKEPGVAEVTYAFTNKFVSVNGVAVESTLAASAKGPWVFSVVSGRDPRGTHEIALGSDTLRQAHASVGSDVTVSLISGTGKAMTGRFRVVGTMAFPPDISNGGGLGVGAVVPLAGAFALACGSPPVGNCALTVHSKLYSPENSAWGMAVRVVPGPRGRAAIATLERRDAGFVNSVVTVPTDLVNFGQAVNFPLLLGITLGVFGAATLAHLLLASAARRRREYALLKVMGFLRRQVRSAVRWQATTVCCIGIAIGVPVGIAAGGAVWHAFATSLGAVPLTVVSAPVVLAIVGGILLGGLFLAVAPAAFAARSRPAGMLHEE